MCRSLHGATSGFRVLYVFVFLHHPRWLLDRYPGSDWERVHGALQDAGNVKAVFAGHIHRMRYDGTRDVRLRSSMPDVKFGKNKKRVEIQKARTEQALYQYENTVLIAFREVADALKEIETYKEQIASKVEEQTGRNQKSEGDM